MNPVSPSAAPSTAPERMVPASTPVMVESTAQPPVTGQITVPPVRGGGLNARQAAQTMHTAGSRRRELPRRQHELRLLALFAEAQRGGVEDPGFPREDDEEHEKDQLPDDPRNPARDAGEPLGDERHADIEVAR